MKKRLPLILILTLGAVLRVTALNQSLWLDEAIEWWAVVTFDLKKLLTGYMLGDFNPPGHHLLMWFWVRVFGESEIALRIPSVLFGVGTIWFTYKIAQTVFSATKDKERLLAAPLLVAVNGLLVYYAQEARMYAMATFFVTAAMYFFLRHHTSKRTSFYLFYLFALSLALYSHYLTWLLLPFFAIWGFRYLVPLFLTIPWWSMLYGQLQAGLSTAGNPVWSALSQTNLRNVSLIVIKFMAGRVSISQLWNDGGIQAALVLTIPILWGFVLYGAFLFWKRGTSRRTAEKAIVCWAFGPLFLGALIGLIVPVFSYFRFLFSLPAVLILLSAGFSRTYRRQMIAVVAGVSLLFSLMYVLNPKNHREDWKELVQTIHRQDEAPTVLMYQAVQPSFDYYDRQRTRVIPAHTLGDSTRPVLLDSLWYIAYAQPIFDPHNSARSALRSQGYLRTYEHHFRGVTLERWDHRESVAQP